MGKKYQNSPALPPKKKRTLPYDLHKLLTQRHLRNTVFDANLNSQSQAACLAHEKHVQIVGNSKIYFTFLIYFYHHIVALRRVAARACAKQAAWGCEFKFASKTAFLRCL